MSHRTGWGPIAALPLCLVSLPLLQSPLLVHVSDKLPEPEVYAQKIFQGWTKWHCIYVEHFVIFPPKFELFLSGGKW